jgi:uncharacterized protein YjbI with pentapeptide repeats
MVDKQVLLNIFLNGARAWNQWRHDHPGIHINLSETTLRLVIANGVNLSEVDLSDSHLGGAYLEEANLAGAELLGANLRGTHLKGAKLNEAYLSNVNLNEADLSGADLTGTGLAFADLTNANLDETNLSGAFLNGTNFGDNNLSTVKGLDSVVHGGPSLIGVNTLNKSGWNVPEVFLRGCGLSEWQIESAKLNRPDLRSEEITSILYRIHDLRAHQVIQINPLFISYNHTDGQFVDKLEVHLNWAGVRFWRDIHHAVSGRLEQQIDRAIRLNPSVLLILSEHSVKSDWVEHEARLARKLELESGRDVLCPIALGDSWKTCRWPERLREQITEYNILDFSDWKDEDNFRRMFRRLIEGLDLFYK